ncbi:uncharacterized protein LOC118499373 [Phyllostomus discolor]|uniref:Uncharacterized protein LOC118499373 n=1 Tax=Phyllostomus discolor TaxID=89673 RepID=A0A7E6D9G9_9CHIR|nr:uncharacterized protein LOC118499373 [Phyllostomus discolor]
MTRGPPPMNQPMGFGGDGSTATFEGTRASGLSLYPLHESRRAALSGTDRAASCPAKDYQLDPQTEFHLLVFSPPKENFVSHKLRFLPVSLGSQNWLQPNPTSEADAPLGQALRRLPTRCGETTPPPPAGEILERRLTLTWEGETGETQRPAVPTWASRERWGSWPSWGPSLESTTATAQESPACLLGPLTPCPSSTSRPYIEPRSPTFYYPPRRCLPLRSSRGSPGGRPLPGPCGSRRGVGSFTPGSNLRRRRRVPGLPDHR